ncbi:hypothetical protein LTR37_007740 [Vermiconidia calcicola]|uniref:Uncharacterized protein n=1 Tax=Vermiconidia calcicola TaxID=1690605 RepID=A0ACC3NDN1_9PEZI|nr:hypothetical protein LTR37_007740 [Vermiconidia calcicola]
MASSLFALLSQHGQIQTRKALILTGLQNDFLSPDGKLPVSTPSGFLDRLGHLVNEFREHGDVIWVRSHFADNRDINSGEAAGDTVIVGPIAQDRDQALQSSNGDEQVSSSPSRKLRSSSDVSEMSTSESGIVQSTETGPSAPNDEPEVDEELFLTRTAKREPCCIPGSTGADYPDQVRSIIDEKRDLQVIKTYYSAFASTSLLATLRAKLVTELYVCGCTTNLSAYATAMDAARHGIRINLIEDCLGYRQKDRHDMAITQLREIMEARVMTSVEVIERIRNPPPSSEADESEADEGSDIAVGEDADVVLDGTVEVDSEEEEEDQATRLLVRTNALRGRVLPCHTDATAPGLPQAAAIELLPIRPTEPREPSSTSNGDSSSDPDDRTVRSSIRPSERTGDEKRERHIEHQLPRTTGDGGLAVKDESPSAGVRRKEPWVDIIEKDQTEQTEQVNKLPARPSHPGLAAMAAAVGLDSKTVNEYQLMMGEARLRNDSANIPERNSEPLFGAGKEAESATSRISFNLLPPKLAATIFDELYSDITWQKMHHQTGEVPRLVCCQGTIGDDGSMPVYRHPSDQTLPIQSWTPAVDKVRKAAEEVVGHSLNHALIQLYRGGTDFISEHSDKTLDIVKDSFIVNVSFGAERTMRLRSKRNGPYTTGSSSGPARTTYRVPMPHNSMIVMSLATNAEYLHGIMADKRPSVELSEEEKAFGGQRISLTFRNIGTFLNGDSSRIWGQGAVAKAAEEANPVINAEAVESERVVRAFGAENQARTIDWDAIYGRGFDVLHLK